MQVLDQLYIYLEKQTSLLSPENATLPESSSPPHDGSTPPNHIQCLLLQLLNLLRKFYCKDLGNYTLNTHHDGPNPL